MSAGPDDFPVDLENCAREPIHIPGAIQPHGVLLVLHEPELTVRQVSENVEDLLGVAVQDVLGQPLALLVGEEAVARLRGALSAGSPAVNPLTLRTAGRAEEREWNAIAHRVDGGLVLELEAAGDDAPSSVAGLFERVRRALARLQATRALPDLFETMAEEIQRIAGLDRVMVYRFDADWNGEVVAEARADGVDGFLGLRFPASDIPAQARELYRRNWLRLIADVGYRPARIVPALNPETGAPLDLSAATLRSVSPVHLEYLRNMHVGASMSVSLLREGELWGLVACHHRTARYLPYEVRAACEFLGQTFSVQLGTLAGENDRAYALELASLRASVLTRTTGDDDWARALVDGRPTLAELAGATGAAVWTGGTAYRVGETPDDTTIAAIAGWLAEAQRDVFHTEHLAAHIPAVTEHAGVASGLLAAAIGRARGDYLLWFRPEAVRTVTWAGNPAKPVQLDTEQPAGAASHSSPVPRLHPRRSFDAWSETVREQSLPWVAAEVDAASAIRDHIVGIVLHQADVLTRLNDELTRSNEELEAFTYIASHDLKEPLRGIHAFAGMLLADQRERLDEEGVEHVETVIRLSERMDTMLDSFLRYSRAGQLELRRVETSMQQLLDDVLDSLGTRLAASGVEIRVPRALPTVLCDPVRAGSVLQNLVSNAIKYNDNARPWVEIGYQERPDAGPVFHVRDNGIGIPARHHDVVFRLFRRLHARERYGGGTGAGLTIARRLVERHGGRIWLDSTPGEGTTFFFTLDRP